MHAADLALARLLRLASPLLPVGAFSYSQGLEAAAERGWVRDEASAQQWLHTVLTCSVASFEAPLWCRLLRAWKSGDLAAVERWNAFFLAARESAELRAETVQMGYSLRVLLMGSGEFDADRVRALESIVEPAFPTGFSFACAAWDIPVRQALLGYLWAWLENQVSAAMKIVPLGQTSGQRLFAALGPTLADCVESALGLDDESLSNCAPGLAIASAAHEIQYSRLFRS